MKVLITGAGGQLGSALQRCLPRGLGGCQTGAGPEMTALRHSELDITDSAKVQAVISAIRPDVVIHTAAYTQVDACESQPELAYRVNAAASGVVAAAAEAVGAATIYISTDYVFPGTKDKPYIESDAPDPRSVYGKSKLAGERAVMAATQHYFIVRTSWVFGREGANFPKAILARAAKGEPLRVVHDQVGCPTFADDLATVLGQLAATRYYGIYHVCNQGSCSWHAFAEAIIRQAGYRVPVEPITTAELGRPAYRPPYSVMQNHALAHNLGLAMRAWPDALAEFMAHMPK